MLFGGEKKGKNSRVVNKMLKALQHTVTAAF